MPVRWPAALPLLLLLTSPVAAQTEEDLKRYFEGKRVTVKIDMPGTEQGVDIYPATDRPLDYPRYASRLKDHGTAIKAGEERDDHQDPGEVEPHRVPPRRWRLWNHGRRDLQLGPRGVHPQEQPGEESRGRAQAGEGSGAPARAEGGARRSARMPANGRTLAIGRGWRRRRNRRSRTSGSAGWRADPGSTSATAMRAPATLTPQGLEAALAEYVDFPNLPVASGASSAAQGHTGVAPGDSAGAGTRMPRKGMRSPTLDASLGQPVETARAHGGQPPRNHPHLPFRRGADHGGVRGGRAFPLLPDLGVAADGGRAPRVAPADAATTHSTAIHCDPCGDSGAR